MSDPMHTVEVTQTRAICGAKTRSGGICQSRPVTGATR